MPKILVVDDSATLRNMHSMVAKTAGYAAVTASNGQEALDLLKKDPGTFRLVITDLNMPIMDGWQLIKLLRRLYPRVYIIACSTEAKQALMVDGYIQKPYSPLVLIDMIKKILS
jgi:two-component system chemotaxis response regulator CheY